MERTAKQALDDGVGDAVRSKVPLSKRLGFWSNNFILWGFVLVISSLLVGGLVGTQLPFWQAVLVILFAGILNTTIAVLIGVIGTRSGYTSAMIYRFSYGRWGAILPNFVMSISAIVWFAVILNLTRDALVNLVGVGPESPAVYWGITLAMAVLFLVPAYKTIRWIALVDYLAAPAILVILVATIWGALEAGGGFTRIIAQEPATSASIFVLFTATAGGWLHGNTVIADFTRFFRNGKQTVVGVGLTYGVLMVVQYIGATLGALATGEWNIFLMMERFGLLEFAFVALFLGSWSTAIAAIYFSANLLSAPPVPEYRNEESTRRLVLLLAWALALVFSWAGPDQMFNFLLQFLAWLIGPIAVTVIADYWLLPARRILYETLGATPDTGINPAAYLAWGAGFVAGYFSQTLFISLLNGMFVAGVVYYGWMRYALSQQTSPESQVRRLFGKPALAGTPATVKR